MLRRALCAHDRQPPGADRTRTRARPEDDSGDRRRYDFEVAIVDDEWVFRFSRRSGVEEALELEIAVLPTLAPALPVNVPSFEYISRNPLFMA